jgi:hypothetical protein
VGSLTSRLRSEPAIRRGTERRASRRHSLLCQRVSSRRR